MCSQYISQHHTHLLAFSCKQLEIIRSQTLICGKYQRSTAESRFNIDKEPAQGTSREGTSEMCIASWQPT